MSITTFLEKIVDITNSVKIKSNKSEKMTLNEITKTLSDLTIAGEVTTKNGIDVTDFIGTKTENIIEQKQYEYSIDYSNNVWNSVGDYCFWYKFSNKTNLTSVVFSNVTSVENSGFRYAFYGCPKLTSADFSNVTTVDAYGFNRSFINCSNLTSADFSNVTSIGSNGFGYAFQYCSNLTSADFSNVTSIGYNGFIYAFQGCSNLTSVDFSNVTTIDSYGFNGAFYGCSKLTSLEFPSLETITASSSSVQFGNNSYIEKMYFPRLSSITDNYLFNTSCTRLSELHFSGKNKSALEATTGYATQWGLGAGKATIYYDLLTAEITLNTNVSDYIVIYDGKITQEPLYFPICNDNSFFVYKDGYCLYEGNYNPPENEEGINVSLTVQLTETGINHTLSINEQPNDTTVISFYKNGCLLKKVTNSQSASIISNCDVDYKITMGNRKTVTGTLTPSDTNVSITLEEIYATIIELKYPFTEYSDYLAHLVDGNNFIVKSDGTVPTNCIVSGPKSYNIDNGFSFGYIEFITPDTTDEEFLTVSVECTNYAESSYDYGVVYLNKSLVNITSNVTLKTSAGTEDSTYGYILYQGMSNQSSVFSTKSKILEPNTKYYLHFYYRKDGSVNNNWDRLAINSIKLPIVG